MVEAMRWLRPLVLLAFVLACGVLAGCGAGGAHSGSNSGPPPQDQAKLRQLRSKLPLLQADDCYRDAGGRVFPQCEKYVTELDSTVGALRNTLAPRGPKLRKAVNGLDEGLGKYHQLRCGLLHGAPTQQQSRQCPRALVEVRNSLDTLNGAIQSSGSTH